MLRWLTLLFALSFSFTGCSDKYLAFKDHYTFKSQDGKPDYSHLYSWAAHPWKWDPSDSLPEPLQKEPRDSMVDVFFLHPTTYTEKQKIKKWNADINDGYVNAKTDYSSILYQASVFNQCRVFAPRYRQAHFRAFFINNDRAQQALELAYSDIKTAFEYYLKNFNNGRPVIIAAHSQGSLHAERLLKEFFEGKPLQKKLVVAYLLGWPVPKNYFTSLLLCKDSVQTGCICTWRTFRKGYEPLYVKKENGNSFVTNPLSWTSDQQFVLPALNTGSVLRNFNKIYYKTTDAQIYNGILWVKKPRFPGGFFYFSKNYHIADINLFYMNIRQNVRKRINMFRKNNLTKSIVHS